MAFEDLLAEGLEQALAELKNTVRTNPSHAGNRIFLFQLQVVLGDWDRALAALKVAKKLDPAAETMAQAYAEVVPCEALRGRIFQGGASPLIFGEPERWIALLVNALGASSRGDWEKATALREEAFEEAPAASGEIAFRDPEGENNESTKREPFAWIADADTRLGPLLEAIVNGKYYWIPFHRIAEIRFEPPQDLRDLVWTPARFTWTNGGEAVGMIPTRYPGSESGSDRMRLARTTEWTEPHPNCYIGQGQRLLATDQNEYPLLDVRSISFNKE